MKRDLNQSTDGPIDRVHAVDGRIKVIERDMFGSMDGYMCVLSGGDRHRHRSDHHANKTTISIHGHAESNPIDLDRSISTSVRVC